MTLDPRTPVLVGVGQLNHRVDQGADALAPVVLLEEAARRAEGDAGGQGVLAALDSIRVVSILSWRYGDPGRLLAERFGADARTIYTTGGGQTPQALVHRTAEDVLAGRADCVLIGGAEAWRSRQGARRDGRDLAWCDQRDAVPDELVGGDLAMNHPLELALGIGLPVQVYPLFDVALRAAEGVSIADHRAHLGALYARFSEVAAVNPQAWNREVYTADEIATATPENRMVGFPYTKRMNSYEMLDQAAALLCCSVERAEALGISTDRWVFPHSGAEAKDSYVSFRRSLDRSPAMVAAGRSALALADTDADGVAHLDLYSCFPSAVRLAARAIGVSDDRDQTVTGGMSFAGGPWNNYVTHSIAAMIEVLRDHPGELGLVSANGGLASKEAFGVYGTRPPVAGFRLAHPQAEVDAVPRREHSTDHEGSVTLETYTVMHDRDGAPTLAIAATLTPAGVRAWATSDEASVMATLLDDTEHVGDAAHRTADGVLTL
ncbi:MAG TPA: acetyl-CoA acetyltransferase [Acidimicrobiales bacterium]